MDEVDRERACSLADDAGAPGMNLLGAGGGDFNANNADLSFERHERLDVVDVPGLEELLAVVATPLARRALALHEGKAVLERLVGFLLERDDRSVPQRGDGSHRRSVGVERIEHEDVDESAVVLVQPLE